MTRDFVPGIELARRFYTQAVAPILGRALGAAPHSAALIGYGSEVQGFDTERSTDHAWGPRTIVLLDDDAFGERGDEIVATLDRELPDRFLGYPVRFPYPPGTPPRHWVHVHGLRRYFAEYIHADPARPLPPRAWLLAPTQVLRELTGGAVFHDGLGLLGTYRGNLAWYPDDVWRYVLACQWMRISQEEPFVGRCGEVGDDLGSAVLAARQVRDLMKLCLLMHRVYPPYSKWLGTAFTQLRCAAKLTPHLSAALAATGWQERERHLTPAYEFAASLHNDLGLTEPVDGAVRHFHSRPFLVLDSFRFTDALVASIADPAVRALPPVGAIDQYVDSTDLMHFERRAQYIAGPVLVG
ncbi:MAG TPA: DUF4037 domain-containing protein [Actinocrinis sp.]